MASDKTQMRAFRFLTKHLQSQEPFKREEFQAATGWEKPGTFDTYMKKQFKGLIEHLGGDRYRVSEAFRPFITWRKFKQHVTQVRRVVTNYTPMSSEVLIYDFLMPLTNEAHLRITLDALFFKDTILARLKTIGRERLTQQIPLRQNESDSAYFERILDWIDRRFIGYSISHVDGRFRSEGLQTQDEVSSIQKQGRRYLVDETTAVTRFIFPYQDNNELETIRVLFDQLFVRSIIQLVNGEDQIWMLESGPQSRVHIWEAADFR